MLTLVVMIVIQTHCPSLQKRRRRPVLKNESRIAMTSLPLLPIPILSHLLLPKLILLTEKVFLEDIATVTQKVVRREGSRSEEYVLGASACIPMIHSIFDP
jgi:hypothetical protein